MEATQKHVGRQAPQTLESFFASLTTSGLLRAEEIEQVLSAASAAPDQGLSSAENAAQVLMEAGKLTPYQARSVLEGKAAELLMGNYEVLEKLGAGGMGTVFKARHRRMKRIVALKVLHRIPGQMDNFVQRFQREIEVVARLAHPNIVMAFDADEADIGHFLVMELINGRDLATVVALRGPLPVAEAVNVLVQSARALEYAHAQGIIHRDIKPANLLLDEGGTVKVTDLGLAKVTADTGLTQSGMVMGTADYMAPEAAFGSATADQRLDIYSLGCTLHFLLMGAPPYPGGSLMAVLLQHQTNPLPRLVAQRPDVPEVLEAVFHKMIAKKPEDRYQAMAEVIRALEGIDLSGLRPITPVGAKPAAALCETATRILTAPERGLAPTLDMPDVRGQSAAALPVLLVEPSRVQASIIRQMLLQLNAGIVLVAANGQKALEAVRMSRPRVIVSALHLTDMTGVELARRVRTEPSGADVGFVLITSGSDAGDLATMSQMAYVVRLPKPFDQAGLAGALTQATAHEHAGVAFPASAD